MIIDRFKDLFYRAVDQAFYPDISQARRVSNELLRAAQSNDTGITIRIDRRWRYRVERHDVRFELDSRKWFVSVAQTMARNVADRNRSGIERDVDLLYRRGAVLN